MTSRHENLSLSPDWSEFLLLVAVHCFPGRVLVNLLCFLFLGHVKFVSEPPELPFSSRSRFGLEESIVQQRELLQPSLLDFRTAICFLLCHIVIAL